MKKRDKFGRFVKDPNTKHPYIGREKEYKKEWYLKNKERLLKEGKERYQRQKEEIFAINKKWQKKHINLVRKYKRINKDRKRFGGHREFIFKKYDNKCVVCKNNDKDYLLIHHIDGNNFLKKTTNNNVNNLVVLCKSCHTKLHHWQRRNKQLKTVEDIVRTMRRLIEV